MLLPVQNLGPVLSCIPNPRPSSALAAPFDPGAEKHRELIPAPSFIRRLAGSGLARGLVAALAESSQRRAGAFPKSQNAVRAEKAGSTVTTSDGIARAMLSAFTRWFSPSERQKIPVAATALTGGLGPRLKWFSHICPFNPNSCPFVIINPGVAETLGGYSRARRAERRCRWKFKTRCLPPEPRLRVGTVGHILLLAQLFPEVGQVGRRRRPGSWQNFW